MFKERNNLYRLTAQIIEWIYGHTGIEYELVSCRLHRNDGDDTTPVHWGFDLKTNHSRSRMRHPLALCVDEVHVVLTGTCEEIPEGLDFDGRIAEFEPEKMIQMFLPQDNGGYSTVAVQFKMVMFAGGEESFARHFRFRNNLMHNLG